MDRRRSRYKQYPGQVINRDSASSHIHCKCLHSKSCKLENGQTQKTQVQYRIVHGRLQLKHQNLRVGSCTEDVLKWFNYSCTRSTQSKFIAALPVLCRGQPNGGESCIVLESRLTHSLKFPHLQYTNFMLQVMNAGNKAIDGCVQNCCREAHQNDRSCVYVSSACTSRI